MSTKLRATIDDLYGLPDVKAEIVDGEIITMSPTGAAPGYAAAEIFVSLRDLFSSHQDRSCRARQCGFQS